MPKLYNLKGQKIGSLTVIEQIAERRGGGILWECKCDCGKVKRLSTKALNKRAKTNRGSCGCYINRKGHLHPQWKGEGIFPANWFYSHIQRGGKARCKVDINITLKDLNKLFIKQKGLCSLTGVKLIVDNRFETNTASVDRIDSSKGYILGNIRFVHKDINMMKRWYTDEYFIKLCKQVSKYNKGGACPIK